MFKGKTKYPRFFISSGKSLGTKHILYWRLNNRKGRTTVFEKKGEVCDCNWSTEMWRKWVKGGWAIEVKEEELALLL